MHQSTKENLSAAFAGESQAHMKYQIFADRADREGLPNVARLFRAISYAERVHASNHFRVLGEVGESRENLEAAIGGETYEVNEMYPAFRAVAELQEEKGAKRTIDWALEAEKVHAGLYQQARQSVVGGDDPDVDVIHVCSVCGWTLEGGDAPDKCPLCGAKGEQFVAF